LKLGCNLKLWKSLWITDFKGLKSKVGAGNAFNGAIRRNVREMKKVYGKGLTLALFLLRDYIKL